MRPSISTILRTSTQTQVSVHGHSSRDRHLSTTTRPDGTTSTSRGYLRANTGRRAHVAHRQSHQSRSRGQIRQGATTLQRRERDPKRKRRLATAMASGDLLLPNWLPCHNVLGPIFGLISHSKFKNAF